MAMRVKGSVEQIRSRAGMERGGVKAEAAEGGGALRQP